MIHVYDTLGRRIQTTDPDSGDSGGPGVWQYGYDANDNLVYENAPGDGLIRASYDQLDRILARCFYSTDTAPGPCTRSGAESQFYYDDDGGLFGKPFLSIAITAPAGAVESWVHDARGRVVGNTKYVQGQTATFAFSYNDADQISAITYPDGEILNHSYNHSGRITSIGASGYSHVIGIEYDLLDRPTRITHGNGVQDTIDYYGSAERYRLQRVKSQRGTTEILEMTYSYDEIGKISSIVDGASSGALSNGVNPFTYDGLGRLKKVDWTAGALNDENYVHDSLGNLSSIDGVPLTYSSTKPHQVEVFDGRNYFRDPAGNLEERRTSASRYETFEYDLLHRLTRSELVDGATTKVSTFGYDHSGMRVSATRDGEIARYFGQYAEARDGYLIKYYYVDDRLVAARHSVASGFGSVFGGKPWTPPPWMPGALLVLCAGVAFLIFFAPGGREVRVGILVAPSRALGSATLLILLQAIPILLAPQCGEVDGIRHFHLDHLGSTQAITDGNGALYEQIRYTAWGRSADASTAAARRSRPARTTASSGRVTRRSTTRGSSTRARASTTRRSASS